MKEHEKWKDLMMKNSMKFNNNKDQHRNVLIFFVKIIYCNIYNKNVLNQYFNDLFIYAFSFQISLKIQLNLQLVLL